MNDYPPDNAEFEEFLAGCGAIIMGRATYDVARRMGEWPYPGKPTVVMTSRPLENAPDGVEARSGKLAGAIDEIEARGHDRVWIEGGGKLVRDMIELGKLDVLEMAVIPIILGDGIPIFPEGTPEMRLSLVTAEPWIKGAMHLIYRRGCETRRPGRAGPRRCRETCCRTTRCICGRSRSR